MDNLCFLLLLILLFLISIVLMAWILPRYIGEPETIYDEGRIQQELGQLVMDNYRLDDFSNPQLDNIQPSDLQPREITLVSGSIDHNKSRVWAPFSKQRLDDYAKYHGYQTYYFDKPIDRNAPAIWQKVYAVRDALQHPECLVVVWFDDDVIITTPQRPIEDFLAMTNKPMIFSMDTCSDHDGSPENYYNVMNSGLFIIRKTPETLAFLDDVIAGRTTLYDGYFNQNGTHDQGVMTYYLYSKYRDSFALMPLGYLQSIYSGKDWQPEHFSLHLAGENALTRYHVMKKVFDNTNLLD